MTDQVKDNPAEHRFELDVGGHLAGAYYRREPGVITFIHTEVPPALGGQGIGSKLVRGALELVRKEGVRVVATCPFVAAYMGKHPEYNDLLDLPGATGTGRNDKKHLDELLDEGLKQTFPASDPPAVVDPTR
jgi:predicted GNAT family acetyltransferase